MQKLTSSIDVIIALIGFLIIGTSVLLAVLRGEGCIPREDPVSEQIQIYKAEH
jgi:hypothetical protein